MGSPIGHELFFANRRRGLEKGEGPNSLRRTIVGKYLTYALRLSDGSRSSHWDP